MKIINYIRNYSFWNVCLAYNIYTLVSVAVFYFFLFIWMAASLWCWVRDRSPRLLMEYQWFNSCTACLSLFFFFHFWVSIVYFLVYFGFSIFLLILIELLLTDIKKINNKEKKKSYNIYQQYFLSLFMH